MPIGSVGLNHSSAPIEVRERLSVSEGEAASELEELYAEEGIEEVVLLSTCNRTECYYRSAEGVSEGKMVDWFGGLGEGRIEGLADYLYSYEGLAVARHLFEVIAGLDSMVMGEVEIAGQVKEAYYRSKDAGTVGKYLNHLFQKSFEVNKKVRSQLGIDEIPVSLSHVAVDRAEELVGGLEEVGATVIGAGEIGELALKYLLQHGIDEVRVTNRTRRRAEELTEKLGGTAVPFERRGELLGRTELVISATGCPDTVIGKEDVPRDRSGTLYLIDLAVPRDVEPGVGRLDSCRLLDIDDLEEVAARNAEAREAQVEEASPIIERGVDEFDEWLSVQEVSGVIRSLRDEIEAIRRSEIEDLDGEALSREEVDQLSARIVNKILHRPTVELKKSAKEGNGHRKLSESLTRLFELDSN